MAVLHKSLAPQGHGDSEIATPCCRIETIRIPNHGSFLAMALEYLPAETAETQGLKERRTPIRRGPWVPMNGSAPQIIGSSRTWRFGDRHSLLADCDDSHSESRKFSLAMGLEYLPAEIAETQGLKERRTPIRRGPWVPMNGSAPQIIGSSRTWRFGDRHSLLAD